ncbi:uncharacterized protein N7483_001094 [Penicillium malachiteum]|uniref:uncharacterized protein n=1 Tax=Penicillium malachiteum TaxID=1324776 RepID=UPI0025480B6C|nr:uncharacterized protein N7483_001094 [Penicillium malachiteum]KAJ5735969.1 hypothetical protein N7483_001094 [Penicillium malachiteum]
MAQGYSQEDGPVEAPPGVMNAKTICEPLSEIPDPAREVLEKWSQIPSADVVQHVNDVRDRAYEVYPWPSIGLYQFLDIHMLGFDSYPEILQSIKEGGLFLDLGCCFAQEIRQLVLDGAPAENVFGADLSIDLMNMGYKLFLDEEKLGVRFITSDIFDSQSTLRSEFKGRFSVIHASNFFHVFPWAKTIEVAKITLGLLSDQPGSTILGTQVGTKRAKNVAFPHVNKTAFFHTPGTWKKLWVIAAEEMGIQVDVQATESYFPSHDLHGWPEELEFIRLRFQIRRLS